ncbi:hypothetical protein Veis_3204 [Verminephrobacter eiseniae EF01-2]|uniref:Uncharacterized protein n=1 Tax=Verminephrobacter eiseniae (strain EF01-2) TaxID=391735 RepID=A1WMS7_VEREI|nr:hypothetical protein Veis_3204 [Verminephrobacter eiseniae EF01-2]
MTDCRRAIFLSAKFVSPLSPMQAVAPPTGRTTGIADTPVRRGPGHEGRTNPDRLLHPPPIRQKESPVIVALPLHPSAHQRISASAHQRISASAHQRISASAHQRISASAHQRISASAHQRISASAHQRISASAHQRISASA